MAKEKELTVSQSIKIVKDMLKNKSLRHKRDSLVPGDLFFGVYDAKDKEQTYDKRPFVLVLRQNKSHIMGLNFHWLPMPFRVSLIKLILQLNKRNIKNGKPLEFSYLQLKPYLKKYGYAPCIRLYIRKRMSSSVTKIAPENLMAAAKLKTEVFTNGKISAEQLYKRALSGNKQYRKTRKRRE